MLLAHQSVDHGQMASAIAVIAATGVITIANGFSTVFTASGNKGVSAQTLPPYKI